MNFKGNFVQCSNFFLADYGPFLLSMPGQRVCGGPQMLEPTRSRL